MTKVSHITPALEAVLKAMMGVCSLLWQSSNISENIKTLYKQTYETEFLTDVILELALFNELMSICTSGAGEQKRNSCIRDVW